MAKKRIIVTAAVIERDGCFLAALRRFGDRYGGLWEFPGGKIEQGESPEACLKREIREELGIEIQVRDLLLTSQHENESTCIELLAYHARLLSGSPQAYEHAALRWIAPSHLHDVEWSPADLPIVELLRRGNQVDPTDP